MSITIASPTALLLLCTVAIAQTPVLVADLEPGTASSGPYRLTAVGDRLLFKAFVQNGETVWSSDGTSAGTVQLPLPPTMEFVSDFTTIGDKGYFFVRHVGATGEELWQTDGTVAGTVALGTIAGLQWPRFRDGFAVGGRALFRASANGAQELWTTDGSPAGTTSLGVGNAWGIGIGSDDAYLVVGYDLWRTDGTVAGTSLFANFSAGFGASHGYFQHLDEHLYFRSNNATASGAWRTDGTTSGTQLVVAISANETFRGFADDHLYWLDSDPFTGGYRATNVHTQVTTNLPFTTNWPTQFFQLQDQWIGTNGYQLSGMNGAGSPTPLASGLHSFAWGMPIVVAGSRYAYAGLGNTIVRTDGTVAGTQTIAQMRGENFALCNGKVFFRGTEATHGAELYVIDPGAIASNVGMAIGEGTRVPRLSLDDPVLGTTVDLKLEGGAAGSFMILMTSFGGRLITPLPFGTWAHTGSLIASLEGIPLASSTWQRQLPVPAAMSLVGLDVWFQAALIAGSTTPLELTGTVHAVLGM